MLNLMRRQSYLIYIIFGGIILIFAINFGPGSSGCAKTQRRADWVAKVGGKTISQSEFAQIYSQQIAYLRKMAEERGRTFDVEMVEKLGVRQGVVDYLIQRRLLTEQGKRWGLQASDSEVARILRYKYGFHQVPYDVYENWVDQTFHISVNQFEEQVRDEVAAFKTQELIFAGVNVSADELKEAFVQDHDRVKISYVRFYHDPKDEKRPSASEVEKFVADHQSDIQSFYNENIFQYQNSEKRHIRHIVKNVSDKLSTEEEDKQRQALLEVKAQIEKGLSFEQAAAQNSDDKSNQGGDLGFLTADNLPDALAKVAFSLPLKTLSDPIRSAQGFHLLEVLEMKPKENRALKDVENEIALELMQKAQAQAHSLKEAQAFLKKLQGKASLQALTIPAASGSQHLKTSNKPVLYTSSWIWQSDSEIPGIGRSKVLHKAAFALNAKKPYGDEPYQVRDSIYVIALKDRQTPDMKEFEADKDTIKTSVLNEKRQKVLKDFISYLRGQSHVEMNPALFAPINQNSSQSG